MTNEGPAPGAAGGSHRAALHRYRFGTAEFDEGRFELRVRGLAVDLQQKPLQLLALLLATPGEVVGKERIFEVVWNDRATGDAVLANAASKLRAALGEDNAARVVTVPRQGYRFDGPVERVAVGRRLASALNFAPGLPVPGRERYRLAALLGRSHTNETWLAEQPKTGDRRVFKFAVDGERLADLKREVTLFRVLRESLGDRPDIARVLDWNFEHAPYWLECEYGGRSLLAWAAEPAPADAQRTRLAAADTDVRLALFGQLADAVAAAHGAGVLHKDLKPANVLVDEAPGGWALRLTDFGSGRLLEPDRLAALHITQLGLTLAPGQAGSSGTPFYIAPELGRGEAPGMRSDVYALGVILYQMLAGDFARLLAPGWERDIGDALLREDIAAATDGEPARRLASAAELAARVRSLPARQAQRVQQAREAQQAAQAQALLARSRARRPWVGAAFALLLAGIGASLWLYAGQRRALDALAQQYALAQALNQLLQQDLIGAANPALSGRADVTVADALQGTAERIDTRFAALPPATRASLHGAMQTALSELSRAAQAVPAGQRAVAALRAAAPGERGALPAVRLLLALDLVQLSRLDEARAVVRDIEADAGAPPSRTPAFRAQLLYVQSWLTGGEMALNESLLQLQQAFALVQPLTPAQAPWRDKIVFALADNLRLVGRLDEAAAMFRRAHDDLAQRFGPVHPRTLFPLVGLGDVLSLQGHHDEARRLLAQAGAGLQRTLGPQHRQTLSARDMLANVQFRQGDFAGAAAEWAAVRDGYAALLGEGSSTTVTAQTNVGLAWLRAGQPARALPSLQAALRHARGFLQNAAPQVQQIRYTLAECLLDVRRPAEAAPLIAGLDAAQINLAQQEPDWPARLAAQRARLAQAGLPGAAAH